MKKEKKVLRRPVETVMADPEQGLTHAQVAQRREYGWTNDASVGAGRTEGEIIARNLFTFFNLVFVVMAVLLALAGSPIQNMTFMIVVVFNLCIGCYQEIRAKRAVDKLKIVAAQKVVTIREDVAEILSSEELVRDDIVEFTVGDQICADGVMLTGQLQVNEALVTGEEKAVTKMPGDSLLSGSFVISGKGRIRLTEVGADAFAARLSREAKENPQAAKSEMMRSLDRLIRYVSMILLPVGILLFCQAYYRENLGLTASTESTVGALVGMIPQGIYLLTSVAMAVSSLKLTRNKVLVKDMNCIETLARVDVLCVDKTGTITKPGMEVEQVIALADVPIGKILTAFYTDMEPENETARAMCRQFAGKTDWICEKRIPFTSENKWSGAAFREQGVIYIGAPEMLLEHGYGEIRGQVEAWLEKGSRVLLVCRGEKEETTPENRQPLALVVLSNRIRAGAKKTLSYFQKQGVQIKVISGDNPLTVSQVACRAGVPGAEKFVDVSTLETEEAIARAAVEYTVFGRVTPDKKRALLRALKAAGHTVAMTGDGVNDVLALKEADCSIAMASGAQAANQVAQLVLLNSDFSAMPAIVGEGRRVINNIQRTSSLFLVKTIFSLGLSVIFLLIGKSFPIIPIHLTLISALTIGTPSFFLAMEPNYERVSGKFLPTVLGRALPGGLTNIIVVLLVQIVMTQLNIPHGQIATACVAVLGVVGLMELYRTCRPFNWFRRTLWGTMSAALVLAMIILQELFMLTYGSWETTGIMAIFMAIAPVVFILLCLLFKKRKKQKSTPTG